MDENLYAVDFNHSKTEVDQPLQFSEYQDLDTLEGIKEFAALDPVDEETTDKDIGSILDILHDPQTEKSLRNLTRLPASKNVAELSDRILSRELAKDLEQLRSQESKPLPVQPVDKLFSVEERLLLNNPNSIQLSSLVEELQTDTTPRPKVLVRNPSPIAFSELSTRSSSMSSIPPPTSGDEQDGTEISASSQASSHELIPELFEFPTPSEEMSAERSDALKTLMSGKGGSAEGVEFHDQKPRLEQDDEEHSENDQNNDDANSQSSSSYFEGQDGKIPNTKGIQTVDAMSAMIMEIEESNTLLKESVYTAPEELFKKVDKQVIDELGVTPFLFSGFAYLSKISNHQYNSIQALGLATSEVSKVVGRTEDKADALRGEMERLCTEVGSLSVEVRKNTVGIAILQKTLERLLISDGRRSPDKPPPKSGITTRGPPNDPPTATVSIPAPISYERYMEMGMSERVKYRKAGGVVPTPCGSSAIHTPITSGGALLLQSQPIITTEPLTRPEDVIPTKKTPELERKVQRTQINDHVVSIKEQAISASLKQRTRGKRRSKQWTAFTSQGISENLLRLKPEQVLNPDQIRKFQEELCQITDKDKEKFVGIKAAVAELATRDPNLCELKELMRRVKNRDDFFCYLNAMASIREGIQEFEA